MQQYDPYQLSNLMMMSNRIPQMPTQPIPPQMYQQPRPMALMGGPSYMYGPQPSQGLQIPPGYNYDPRTGTQYGIPQGGSNNPQYTYPANPNDPYSGILGAGAYRPAHG